MRPPNSEAPSRQRVLIVEDDPLARFLYKSHLRPYADRIDLHLESSGESALTELARHRTDAVILDWDLPGISGLDVLCWMRSQPALKETPVLMVTGRSAADDEKTALRLGATAFQTKPVSPEGLADALKEVSMLKPSPPGG